MFSIQRHGKHSRQYNMLSTNINTTYSPADKSIHNNLLILQSTCVELNSVLIVLPCFRIQLFPTARHLNAYYTISISHRFPEWLSYHKINDYNVVILWTYNIHFRKLHLSIKTYVLFEFRYNSEISANLSKTKSDTLKHFNITFKH